MKFLRSVIAFFRSLEVLLWYVTGRLIPTLAVRRLVATLGCRYETARTAAYLAIIKLGPKNIPRLKRLAASTKRLPSLLQVIGDLGGKEEVVWLEQFKKSSNEEVVAAAIDSQSAIHDRLGDGD